MKKVVYVTGCLGFIGIHVTRACLDRGWYVLGVDKMTYASNNWALDGTRSQHGGAILANDMHLGLRLPHIWYRADLVYPQADGSVCGVRPQVGADAALKLDCGAGLGAATHVTGTFGFAMAGKALELVLKAKAR